MSVDVKTIAFVGLGVMGEAMCRNLARKGKWRVVGFDARPEPLERLKADGVTAAKSLAEAAAAAEVIIMCLPGGREVEAVTRGSGGLIGLVSAGQTVVDMSTSPPRLMRELANAFGEKGVAFADAPVARTRQAAVDGTLCIMVGGERTLYERLQPILATMGTEIPHCGAVGAGQVVKIMNNMVVFQTTMALGEAISIAEASGVDGKVLFETMSKGSADSFVLRNHGMKSLLPEDYPLQAFSVKYAIKDLSYARELAKEAGVVARGAEVLNGLMEDAIARGDGDRYTPVIRRGMEPKKLGK
ncbi:MAG: NAD(P)-dependent oxidoreductase [Proteobacteria bacterium]|nr:NAD(P)-dependent oxidoreductase [Pseudomonadota bacterium]